MTCISASWFSLRTRMVVGLCTCRDVRIDCGPCAQLCLWGVCPCRSARETTHTPRQNRKAKSWDWKLDLETKGVHHSATPRGATPRLIHTHTPFLGVRRLRPPSRRSRGNFLSGRDRRASPPHPFSTAGTLTPDRSHVPTLIKRPLECSGALEQEVEQGRAVHLLLCGGSLQSGNSRLQSGQGVSRASQVCVCGLSNSVWSFSNYRQYPFENNTQYSTDLMQLRPVF